MDNAKRSGEHEIFHEISQHESIVDLNELSILLKVTRPMGGPNLGTIIMLGL